MSVSTARPALATARATTAALAACAAAAAAAVTVLAACSSPPPSHPAAPAASPAATTTKVPLVKAAAPPPKPQVTVTRVRTSDGALVIVAVFRGPVRYVLHDGSVDPGPVPGLQARAAVAGAERSRLLAAFNGGFKLSAGAGGYEQEGHVISPLRSGFASLVIDRSGRARIGVWGHGVPAPGEAVYSVRQNLVPLVLDGRPTAASADWGRWGATLGGGADVARSALGQDAAGDLIYAASMSALPADLAAVLADHGARIAMQLDINPEWVQLDVAHTPGGPLTAGIPGQNRPADQYLLGWARDFVAVETAPAALAGARSARDLP